MMQNRRSLSYPSPYHTRACQVESLRYGVLVPRELRQAWHRVDVRPTATVAVVVVVSSRTLSSSIHVVIIVARVDVARSADFTSDAITVVLVVVVAFFASKSGPSMRSLSSQLGLGSGAHCFQNARCSARVAAFSQRPALSPSRAALGGDRTGCGKTAGIQDGRNSGTFGFASGRSRDRAPDAVRLV